MSLVVGIRSVDKVALSGFVGIYTINPSLSHPQLGPDIYQKDASHFLVFVTVANMWSLVDAVNFSSAYWTSPVLEGEYTSSGGASGPAYVGTQSNSLTCTGTMTPDVTGEYIHDGFYDTNDSVWAKHWKHITNTYYLVHNSLNQVWTLGENIDGSAGIFIKFSSDETEYSGDYPVDEGGTGTAVFEEYIPEVVISGDVFSGSVGGGGLGYSKPSMDYEFREKKVVVGMVKGKSSVKLMKVKTRFLR